MKKSLFTAFAVGLSLTANLMAQVPNYVPTNGLVGWWPFNGNANDESGNGNNGTVNGATLSTDRFGNANKAYSFNGNGNFISIPNSNSLNPQDITMNSWFYIDQSYTSGNLNILSKLNHNSASYVGYYMNIDSLTYKKGAGYSIIGCSSGTGVGGYETKKSMYTQKGVWHMLTATVSNSGMINLFLNGVLIHQNQGGSFNPCNNSLSELRFGHWWNADNQWFYGELDDIGIWNRALTQQEITDLYNATNCGNDLTISPTVNSLQTGNTANFIATTSDANSTFTWQSDFGQGYVTLNDYGNYSGTSTNSFSISNVQLANHNQPIRAISSNTNCTDTSNVATIQIADTCITTIYDTLYTTVTDTLIINTTLSLPAPNNENTILIYPNPASDHITIDNGNYLAMAGYTIKIQINAGQQVFQSAVNQPQFYIDLSTWSGNGLYFVHLIDPQNNTVTVRKIVLQ